MVVIIFDLETSGLNPYHEDIIEIGAKVLGEDNSFQMLLKPKSGRPISKKITELTGITNKDLRKDGKDWKNAYGEFYNWLFEIVKSGDPLTLVSHNGVSFDFVFFKRMLRDLEQVIDEINIDVDTINFVDTLPLSKRLYPNRTYYSQPSLAKTFSIIVDNAHRAMGDVIVLEQLYLRIMKDFNIHSGADGLEDPRKVGDYINLKI